jgi:hypothetical protein
MYFEQNNYINMLLKLEYIAKRLIAARDNKSSISAPIIKIAIAAVQ